MTSCRFHLPPCFGGLLFFIACLTLSARAGAQSPPPLTAAALQAALDAEPGRMVFVPAGDYPTSQALRIRHDGTGLYGPGRIIQNDPTQPILDIESARGVQVRDVILTRAAGTQEASACGLQVQSCADFTAQNVQVIDNHGANALYVSHCTNAQVLDCRVDNYMKITVDDRTANAGYGYAFNCIDGSGIVIDDSTGTLVRGCRVIEHQMLATPELKAKYDLGKVIKKNPEPGTLINPEAFKNLTYVNNWHQGSGIVVSGPRTTDCTRLIENHVENAAQGLDIHCDHIIISGNIINNAFIGMKAMHGARHVIITGNQFTRNDLWGIMLMPGAASDAAQPAKDGQPAQEANVDGGSIVANNIIADFGYGHEYWVWKTDGSGPDDHCPITLLTGQEPSDPPLRDVVIQGNVVYDSGRDQVLVDGVPKVEGPRYAYALYIADGERGPQNIVVGQNIFHPGKFGVANRKLEP